MYRYKKYTDVRLVFAPEQEIAFFGGDPDNFTFPRHDVDICLVRAYENGQPAKPQSYLPFSAAGVADGDLVFVSGNPGSTSRLYTQAQLELVRDVELPLSLEFIKRRLSVLREYSARGSEQARRAKAQVFNFENSQKALEGRLRALLDAKAMAAKAAEEKELRARVAGDAELKAVSGDAWATIEAAQKKAASRASDEFLVSFAGSRLLQIAGQIVRYVAEVEEAERAAARGVHRLEPRDPQEPAVLAGAALRRPRGGDARQPARGRAREAGPLAPVREGRARRRGSRGGGEGGRSPARSSRTPRPARRSSRADPRRSRPRPTR